MTNEVGGGDREPDLGGRGDDHCRISFRTAKKLLDQMFIYHSLIGRNKWETRGIITPGVATLRTFSEDTFFLCCRISRSMGRSARSSRMLNVWNTPLIFIDSVLGKRQRVCSIDFYQRNLAANFDHKRWLSAMAYCVGVNVFFMNRGCTEIPSMECQYFSRRFALDANRGLNYKMGMFLILQNIRI